MPKQRTNESSAPPPLALPDIPLDALFSFLKDTRGAVNWSAKDLKDCLKLDAKQTQQILPILEMQGYVAKEGSDWLTTAAGESVSHSKKPQFSSESVNQALDTLKERIEAVNRDKRSEFKVAKAVAFGDFLTGRAQVQAADVGVELSRRDLSGNPDDMEVKLQEFMNGLRRKSRLFTVQTYRPWMSHRSHRNLL
jgi:hypothetical protein